MEAVAIPFIVQETQLGLKKWLAPNPKIFMPSWYPPIIVQSKPTNKLPC